MHSSSSPTSNAWLHNGATETDLIGLAAAASTQAYRRERLWIRDSFCPDLVILMLVIQIHIVSAFLSDQTSLGGGGGHCLLFEVQNFNFKPPSLGNKSSGCYCERMHGQFAIHHCFVKSDDFPYTLMGMIRLAVIFSLVCAFTNTSWIMSESSSESYVHLLCSIARTHSRVTSAVIFLLTTGGVVYLLLRQVL